RKLFFNLRKTKQRLGWFNQDEVEMVARELGVSSKDVREMESRYHCSRAPSSHRALSQTALSRPYILRPVCGWRCLPLHSPYNQP
ncbi:hypothetical protein MJI20_30395, partial [Salmonella enterica subsp. enterica serovar Anatum]|nr:hypothetical protein [Salmonella enterica subsp. enterica serovar Anatum]